MHSRKQAQLSLAFITRAAIALAIAIFSLLLAAPLRCQQTPSENIPPDVTISDPDAPSAVLSAPASTSIQGESAPGMVSGTSPAVEFFKPVGWPFSGSSSPAAGARAGIPPGFSGNPTGTNTEFAPGLSAPPSGQPPGLPPGLSAAGSGRPSTALGQTPARPNWMPSGLTGQPAPAVTQKDPLAVIDTTKGTIVVRLFRKLAPNTVTHFMYICQSGFYNGLTFHRVMPGVLVQGGCPHGNGSGYFVDPVSQQPKFVMPEISPQLKHNAAGVVGIARAGKSPLSASSQFYITMSPQPRMDGASSIFGGVVSGLDVVNQIQSGDKILRISVQEQP